MPIASTIVPTTSPTTAGHAAMTPIPMRREDERDRSGAPATEPVRQPRTDDADNEDQHAVQEEDRPGTDVESLVDVQRHERAEPGERDQPEEQHGAGEQRGAVDELRRLAADVGDVAGAQAEQRRDRSASAADTSHASV